MPTLDASSSMIFMKVGRHDGEAFEDIIRRKREEYDKTGMIFWGYGGGTMHPISKVQPFCKMHIDHGEDIRLIMCEIQSDHPYTAAYATEFSRDGELWEPIPKGIRVTGSRYALVLDEIMEGDLSVDLSHYRVGIGPSAGKVASDYIAGRVDKGLLERSGIPNEEIPSKVIESRFQARLKEPFAVLLRTTTET